MQEKEKVRASKRIETQLFSHLSNYAPDMPLLSYRSMDDEVDTSGIFSGKVEIAYAPVQVQDGEMQWARVDASTVWKNHILGFKEPASNEFWQDSMQAIVICPMLAFDRKGGRLGFGQGYFDRWLAKHHAHIKTTIGLAFACQESKKIPVMAHDVSMDVIITEKECIACGHLRNVNDG